MTLPLRRVLGGLALTAVALSVLVAPASAGSVSRPDTAGDGSTPGNIIGIRLSQAGGDLIAQVRTRRAIDIETAPSWNAGSSTTFLRFNFDTLGDRAVDVGLFVDSAGVAVFHPTPAPAPRAPCAGVTQPVPTVIRVRVSLECLDVPAHIRGFARYHFDIGGDGDPVGDEDDRAPDLGYTPFLTLES